MKFSVIVTIYNVENYLEKCLNSLKILPRENFEIILVNDGSTDSSLEIIENFVNQFCSNEYIVITKPNGGLSSARNAGLDIATGDYIIFIDGDDYIIPERLMELCQNLDAQYDAIVTSPVIEYQTLQTLKEADKEYFSIPEAGGKNASELDLFTIPAVAWSKLYRASIVRKIHLRFPQGVFYEDNYWHWMFMKEATSVFFSDVVFYTYVRRPDSIMSNTFSKQEGHSIQRIEVLQRILGDCRKLDKEEKLRLINEFLFVALKDSSKGERFKIINLIQKILRNIDEKDLSPFFIDIKNCNVDIMRHNELSIQNLRLGFLFFLSRAKIKSIKFIKRLIKKIKYLR